MKHLDYLDKYRTPPLGDSKNGAFLVPSPIDQKLMRVIASDGGGWDHVSVSRAHRCPNWPEMTFIKGLFFEPDEVAYQLHVAESEHINNHPYCLHIWRPQEVEIPTPPGFMVGIKGIAPSDIPRGSLTVQALLAAINS
jgi:hypothetical protein